MKKQILKKVLLLILPTALCAVLFGCVYLQYFQQLHTKSRSVKLNDAYNTSTQQ